MVKKNFIEKITIKKIKNSQKLFFFAHGWTNVFYQQFFFIVQNAPKRQEIVLSHKSDTYHEV